MEENKTTNVSEETLENTETAKTYTEDEVLKLIQSEADRRVNQALEKQKKQYEKQLTLSSLDEEQRNIASKDMRIQELEEQLQEFNRLQTKNEMISVLSSRGLNPAFADLLSIGTDVAEAQANIDKFDKLFKAAVADEVKKRLASNVPTVGADSSGTITKEAFKKMSIAQRTELYHRDPDLYKQLSQ